MKTIFGKVMWVGRATVFMVGLAVILAVVLGAATRALAGTGVGATFNLGETNTVDKLSSLVGSATSVMLRIDNNGTGPALYLQVEPGKAPMTVNSSTKVPKLNSDRIDGKDASDFARAYKRTVVVGPVPGDPSASGTALRNALNGITNASQSNPYLLKVEPGVYDMGTSNPLVMKQYVDIEGSGEGVTTIECACPSDAVFNAGTVKGASNTELRFVTIKNTGSGPASIAVFNNAASSRLIHVTAMASGGSIYNLGVVNGDSGSGTKMSHVTATASGGTESTGVYNYYSSPTMTGVNATASGGV